MRPNSLFFDRGGKQGLAHMASIIVTIAFLVICGYILIRYKRFAYLLHGALFTTPMFGWLLLGYAALAVLFVLVIRWANCRVKRIPALWAVSIFIMALLPRALVLLVLRAPAFGGAVFGRLNLSALLLQDNLPALLFCVISAFSAVVVYLIARRFDEGSAPAAGLLFALYPANSVLAQGQSVLQVAVLCALLAVLFALVAFSAIERGRILTFSALSGASLAVCGIVLASAWLVALALGAFWLVLVLSSHGQEKEPTRLLLLAFAFCAVFFSLRLVGVASPNEEQLDVGLSGATASGAAQQAREGEALLDSLDWDTLQKGYDVKGSPVRLDQNLTQLWLEKDAALSAATATSAFTSSALAPFAQGICLMDFFYIAGILLFAWIGGLLRRRGGAGDLLLWVFLVWALSHLFSDRQAITRALGMPILMIFASYGVFAIVGTQPRPKEQGKYASCANRGALNLGDIPPEDGNPRRTDDSRFARATAKPQAVQAGGLFAAMEADIAKSNQQKQTKMLS